VLFVLAPLGVAVAPHVTLRAPFHGAVWSGTNSEYSGGCGHFKQTASKWSSTTGIGHWWESVRAAVCPSSLGGVGSSSYAFATGGIDIAVPVTIPSSAAHSIVVHWNVSALGTHVLTPGACVTSNASVYSCDRYARWTVLGDAHLVDLTTGATNQSTNSLFWTSEVAKRTDCSATCSTTGGTSGSGRGGLVTFFINVSGLTSTDRFALVTSINGYVDVDFTSFNTVISGGSGSAILNVGTAHGVTLKDIVVT
jgi:hypothetical protein